MHIAGLENAPHVVLSQRDDHQVGREHGVSRNRDLVRRSRSARHDDGMQTEDWRPLTAVEGLALLGGEGRIRLLEEAASGLAYLIHYPAGVAG